MEVHSYLVDDRRAAGYDIRTELPGIRPGPGPPGPWVTWADGDYGTS